MTILTYWRIKIGYTSRRKILFLLLVEKLDFYSVSLAFTYVILEIAFGLFLN
jgi:hypothetical protein